MKLFELHSMMGQRYGDDRLDPRSPNYSGPDQEDNIHTVPVKVQIEIDHRPCVLHASVDVSQESGGINRPDIRKIDSVRVTEVEFEGGVRMKPEDVVAKFGPEALEPGMIRDVIADSLDM